MLEIVDVGGMKDHLSREWRSFAEAPENLIPAQAVMFEGRLLAIGTLRRNPLHPLPVHFDFLLADNSPVECLSSLLVELTRVGRFGADDLIHVVVDWSDRRLITWAHQSGFAKRMVTYQCRLLPHAVENLSPVDGIHCLADHDSPGLRRALAECHDHIYRAAHVWNPPGDLVTERAHDLFMGDDLLPEYLWYVAEADGEPIGVASLRRSDVSGCIELGWIGTLPGVDSGLRMSLIDTALQAAGTRTILIEVDENEAELIARLRQLPTIWESSKIRFERTEKESS